jgi:hypothetical protein
LLKLLLLLIILLAVTDVVGEDTIEFGPKTIFEIGMCSGIGDLSLPD